MPTQATQEDHVQNHETLNHRLEQIRSSPKQQNQQQAALVLKAIEDTLKEQRSEFTPTAYFAALLALLNQHVSTVASSSKDVSTAIVYLLDLISSYVPAPLLRSKFSQILNSIAPALSRSDVDAPFLRSSIGCLVSLLLAQDHQAWSLPQSQTGPRKAAAGLLTLAADPRPKVRKRAQDGLATVLGNPPPSPSLDHPAADMCAETALRSFLTLAESARHSKKAQADGSEQQPDSSLIHSLQLIKVIASASNGWPTRSLESLCEGLFAVAGSRSEFLTMTAFEVFETVFDGLSKDTTFSKLPRLLETVAELQPSRNDSQLLPPWLATISRGYDVSAQLEPIETFQKLPDLFKKISSFLTSSSYNIRVSAAECLVSLLVNCVPNSVILEPSVYDEKTLEKLSVTAIDLMGVRYQASWMEIFKVVGAMFDAFKWRSYPLLSGVLSIVGDLRSSESFAGKDKADEVLSEAIKAMGPENFLKILPLNILVQSSERPGRAWLMPLIRDSVSNTNLMHFKTEFIPLSEKLFQRTLDQHESQKNTMQTKVWDTLIQQIWSCMPGYCTRPLDVQSAFDREFAELIANLLYKQPAMRNGICKALKALIDSLKSIVETASNSEEEDLVEQGRISKDDAETSLKHMTSFAPDLAAVLFNVYEKTAPQQRGPILACIDAYLSITDSKELSKTFDRVTTMLASALEENLSEATSENVNKKKKDNAAPPMSHSLMDIVITMAVYLPRDSYQSLFAMAAMILSKQQQPQLQKKAYKLLPRLAQSPVGRSALQERSAELQQMLLNSAESTSMPARRDRLLALAEVVDLILPQDLYFVPSILSEVILCTKESNEKAREAAYELIVRMGEKMADGGTVDNSRVSHMPDDAPSVPASLEEYFTMLSAGLAGSTPHMISASVTAISRALYQFKASLPNDAVMELVETMDLFLQSPSREIVGSVLGFVKVCVLGLADNIMLPRLPTLIPHLISWSHEHKGHFKTKVRNILERMIRKYGVEIVERHCPEEDRKLITNIRKTRDRKKRKKSAVDAEMDETSPNATAGAGQQPPGSTRQRARFENEFDEAIYGSDSDDSVIEGPGDEIEDVPRAQANRSNKKKTQTYIHEDEDEPLDLLSSKALANISSTKPLKPRQLPGKRKVDMDIDGKLVLKGDEDNAGDADMMDVDGVEPGDGATLEQGIDAYVQAIRGRDAPTRGQRGRLKFSNKRGGGITDHDEDEKDNAVPAERPGSGYRGAKSMPPHRSQDMGRIRGGRVAKFRGAARGGARGRGRGRGSGRGMR